MANKNLRGITIEIGGDTTKLGKALEDSEKKSRSLNTELKAIEQSLKFNPGNVELLTQKQTVLSQSIAETSDKLNTLKEAERQVIAQFERGEVAEDQVRALQREILKTENQLESMSTELKSTNKHLKDLDKGVRETGESTQDYAKKVADAEKELEEFGNTASETFDILKTGAGAVGAGAVALGGYALNLSTEFDKAYNSLQAQTGATTEEMVELNESMENIYKNNFGESIEDVANSMAIVKTQTKLTGDELQKTTEYAILFRDTFGFEVEESTRSASMLMKQFGLSSQEAYNLMAQGAQAGLNKNGDLMDVVNEYAVHFQQLGFDAEEMFNILVAGSENGAFSVDKVGDAFKEFGIRVKDESDATMSAFEQLGLNSEEISKAFAKGGDESAKAYLKVNEALAGLDDPLKQNQIGVALYGTMWEDLGVKAVQAMANYGDEFNSTRETMESINDIKYDDIGSAIAGLGRELQTELIDPLGDELKPVVEDAIDYVKENGPQIKEVIGNVVKAVGDFVKMVVDNSDIIVSTIVAIGAGMLAWNVVSIITSVVGAVKSFITVLQSGKTIMQALNLVMSANPIGLIVTAIAVLVAGFITLWNTSDEFRNFWLGLWEAVKNAVSSAIDWIVGLFNTVVDFFTNNWQDILLFILNPFAGVFKYLYENFEGFRNFVDGIVNAIVEFFVEWGTKIAEVASNIWASIVEFFSPAVEWFSALFTSIYDTLASVIQVIIVLAQGTWTIIKEIFSIVATWFNNTVITPVKNAFSKLWDGVKSLASTAWSGIKSVWNSVSGWFKSTIVSPISNFFSDMWSKLKSGASEAWTGIKNVFSNVTTWFKDKFTQAWTGVKNVFSTGGKIFSGITEGITSAFKKVVNAIISGINKVVATPFNGINNVLSTIRNASIAGLKPFSKLPSISVPQIPQLYQGGILKRGQVGLLEGNGAEAVVPLEKETGWINRIAQKMNDLQDVRPGASALELSSKMDEMIHTMKSLKSTIVLDTGVLVGETVNQMDARLGEIYTLRERGV